MIQIKKDTKLNTKKIGADRADFDLDVIEVKIKKKLLERCIDVVVTLLVAIVAVTVATVFIIPLFG